MWEKSWFPRAIAVFQEKHWKEIIHHAFVRSWSVIIMHMYAYVYNMYEPLPTKPRTSHLWPFWCVLFEREMVSEVGFLMALSDHSDACILDSLTYLWSDFLFNKFCGFQQSPIAKELPFYRLHGKLSNAYIARPFSGMPSLHHGEACKVGRCCDLADTPRPKVQRWTRCGPWYWLFVSRATLAGSKGSGRDTSENREGWAQHHPDVLASSALMSSIRLLVQPMPWYMYRHLQRTAGGFA